jgi:hypothetical protein
MWTEIEENDFRLKLKQFACGEVSRGVWIELGKNDSRLKLKLFACGGFPQLSTKAVDSADFSGFHGQTTVAVL